MTLENLSEQKLLFTHKISFVTAELVLPDFCAILLIDVDQINVALKQKSRSPDFYAIPNNGSIRR